MVRALAEKLAWWSKPRVLYSLSSMHIGNGIYTRMVVVTGEVIQTRLTNGKPTTTCHAERTNQHNQFSYQENLLEINR
jgi:hypothetical protein